MSAIAIKGPGKETLAPGVVGWVVGMHGRFYSDNWRFGADFEADVAAGLGDYVMGYVSGRDGVWTAFDGEDPVGFVAVDGARCEDCWARLRWFIVSPRLQGQGLGRRLLGRALDFAAATGRRNISLWTFEGLDLARALYVDSGFEVVEELRRDMGGVRMTMQRMAARIR